MIDQDQTESTRRRYDRIAPVYDAMERLSERRNRPWRRQLWSLVRGPAVLEVGVGTGKNIPFYPAGLKLTAIDLAPRMLDHAHRRAASLDVDVDLRLGDAQTLDFPDGEFDDVVTTFVFCSVPDPVLGLTEVRRVLKPGGQLLMLEHVRAANSLLGLLMDAANPLAVRMTGANINRRTVENVGRAGLELERVEDVGLRGIFKLIVARRV
jgi:ubiquinone/menaquinone biosynthesis C-methylase UbiE